ncbi:MAG: ComEC/Rec2 family competence protein [Bacillota bacterium]
MQRPIPAMAVALALGIGAAQAARPHPVVAAAVLLVGLVAAGASRQGSRRLAWLLLAVAGAGALRYGWLRYRGPGPLGQWLDRPVELVGTLREVRREEDRWEAVLAVEAIRSHWEGSLPEGSLPGKEDAGASEEPAGPPAGSAPTPAGTRPGQPPAGWQSAQGRVWLRYRLPRGRTPDSLPREGDRVEVAGRLEMPERANWPGQFDRREYLARQGIFLKMELRSPPVSLGKGRLPWPLALALSARERFLAQLGEALPPRQAGLLAGLLLGWREAIPPEWEEAFRRTGVLHVLAASGANVAFVVMPFRRLAGWLGLGPRWAAVLSIGVAWCYCLLAGGEPPVARAALMATLLYLGEAQGRPAQGLNSLAVAGLLLLAWRPGLLFDLGFQLSFAATLGILTLARPLEGWLQARVPGPMAGPLAVTLAAGAAVEPLLLHRFGALTLISPIANLWVAVAAEAAVLVGAGGLLAGLVLPPVGGPVLAAAGWLLDLLVHPVVAWSHAPGAFLQVPPLPWPGVVLWYGLLGAWWARDRVADVLLRAAGRGRSAVLRPGAWRRIGLPVAALLAPALPLAWGVGGHLSTLGLPGGDQGLQVHFLDVGQGDAVLVRFPGGRTMLVDGGGAGVEAGVPFDAGRQRVVPFLRRQGIRRLDWVVVTHPDQDHVGGLPAVAAAVPVGEIWVSAGAGTGSGQAALLAVAESRKIPVRAVAAGERLEPAPGVRVEVLNPPPAGPAGGREGLISRNEASVVLSVAYGAQAFLLAGDIGRETEARLATGGAPVRASVLKVGHHGSATSTGPEWLEAVGGPVAVISVGNNRYGHPSPWVIDRLRQAGYRTYRTDRHGTVSFLTDGVRLYVATAGNPWPDRRFRWFGAW